MGVLLTDGGEGAEKEEERTFGGEKGTGVGVELRVERGEYPELYRSFLCLLLALASSFGADLDSRHPMTVQYAVIMRTRLS